MRDRPLRVLHVIPSMGAAGAERQLCYLARALVERGLELHVAHFAGGPNLPRLYASGANVHPIEGSGNYDPFLLLRLARVARRVRPDLIQTWLTMADVLGGVVARGLGVPWVFAERYLPSALDDVWKARLAHGLAARFAAAVVSNSAAADAEWAARLGPRVRRQVIRNALPVEEVAASAAAEPVSVRLPEGIPLVLYVGRLQPTKGIATLLSALEYAAAGRPLAALFIGEGELRADLERAGREGALAGRVAAPGYRADVAAWLARAAVFVSLSRFEGMPNTVMEAMAVGCPVVCSDIPQHREILDEESALFVPPGDAAAGAAGILRALSDPEAAAARARRAHARAQDWSPAAVAAEWGRLYELVVAGKCDPRRDLR